MSWNLTNDRPIYLQIVERIQMAIVSGAYQPGDKLPSVRELAAEASVNPNTMQKALSELETGGLVYTQRTSGRFITEDRELIASTRRRLAREEFHTFVRQMKGLGYTPEDIAQLTRQLLEEGTKIDE